MIRVIIRTDDASMPAHVGGSVVTTYRTIDIEAPEVEAALRSGGRNGGGSFSHTQVVGVELLIPATAHQEPIRHEG